LQQIGGVFIQSERKGKPIRKMMINLGALGNMGGTSGYPGGRSGYGYV